MKAFLMVLPLALLLLGASTPDAPSPAGDSAPESAAASPSPESETTQVFLRTKLESVEVGTEVVVRVEIEAPSEVVSVPFHLLFDTGVLEYKSASEGTFLNKDGGTTAFLVSALDSGDRVVVGASRLGAAGGIKGKGVLCELTFVAVGAGDASLRFDRAKVFGLEREPKPSTFATVGLRIR